MAILTAQTSTDGPRTGWPLGDALVQPGQPVAVCLDVKDSLGIERPTFDDPTVMETVDLTRFLFGLPDGSMIQTGEMKISGHEKSNLVKFLTGWLGKPPRMDGSWDYREMKGQGAMLNVAHRVSRKGRTYADCQGISGVMDQLAAQVPNVAQFAVPEGAPPATEPQVQPVAQPVVQPVDVGDTLEKGRRVHQIVEDHYAKAQPVVQPAAPAAPTPPAATTQGNMFTPVATNPDF